jgi:hypothetical protein
MTLRKLHIADPEVCVTVENLVARPTWCPEFYHPCNMPSLINKVFFFSYDYECRHRLVTSATVTSRLCDGGMEVRTELYELFLLILRFGVSAFTWMFLRRFLYGAFAVTSDRHMNSSVWLHLMVPGQMLPSEGCGGQNRLNGCFFLNLLSGRVACCIAVRCTANLPQLYRVCS